MSQRIKKVKFESTGMDENVLRPSDTNQATNRQPQASNNTKPKTAANNGFQEDNKRKRKRDETETTTEVSRRIQKMDYWIETLLKEGNGLHKEITSLDGEINRLYREIIDRQRQITRLTEIENHRIMKSTFLRSDTIRLLEAKISLLTRANKNA